jgi:hypothetical protein
MEVLPAGFHGSHFTRLLDPLAPRHGNEGFFQNKTRSTLFSSTGIALLKACY